MEEIQLLSILKKAVQTDVELVSCSLLKDKADYWVWEANTKNPALHLIVKIAGPGAQYSSRFERTAAITHLVRQQTTIPMPDVLAADESCRLWPWKFFIKTYIPGQEFAAVREQMTPAERNLATAQIGDAVAQIHTIRFSGFGNISADGQVTPAMGCLDALKAHAERIFARKGKDEREEHFLAEMEPRQDLFAGLTQACLCHEDLHQHNILFERRDGSWRLATILDFEKAWAGLPDCDLARMDLWAMTGEDFWQAYTARLPVDPGYPARRALLQYLWCLEVAWDTPAHRATTAAVLQDLHSQAVSPTTLQGET